jgi:hypothetical protein
VPHGGWENWFKSEVELPFSSLTQTKSYMRLARDKELVYVISSDDSAFNLNNINNAISNATEEEKAEAEQLKKELVEQEEVKDAF